MWIAVAALLASPFGLSCSFTEGVVTVGGGDPQPIEATKVEPFNASIDLANKRWCLQSKGECGAPQPLTYTQSTITLMDKPDFALSLNRGSGQLDWASSMQFAHFRKAYTCEKAAYIAPAQNKF